MKRLFVFTAVSLCLLTAVADAADFPGTDVPSNVGVNVHITPGYFGPNWVDFGPLLDRVQQAGIGVVRTDFFWGHIEQTLGGRRWDEYDAFVRAAADRGIRVMATLSYANGLYGDTTTPAYYGTDAFRNAYAAYAGDVAAHYSNYTDSDGHAIPKMTFELWNEPNGSGFWPGADPNQYMAMVNLAAPAIRAADSNVTIVAPALSAVNNIPGHIDWNTYLTTCFQQGLLSKVDGISVHPYRWGSGTNPETVVSGGAPGFSFSYDALHSMMNSYGGQNVEIISGEWGYSTTWSEMTAQKQADYAARMMLTNFSQGIPYSIYYNFQDYGNDPNEGEYNFGLTANDGTPKPAYYAIQTLTNNLAGKNYTAKVNDGHSEDYILAFQNAAGRKTYTAWTTGNPATRKDISLAGGSIRARLTNTPVYLGEVQQLQSTGTATWSTATWGNSTGGGNGGWVAGGQAKLVNANQTINVSSNVDFSGIQFEANGISINGDGGSLVLGSGGAVINNGTTTFFDLIPVPYDVTINANMIGGGDPAACPVVKSGAGQLTLGGQNTFAGNFIIAEGTVKANSADALAGPVVTVNNNNSLTFGTGINNFNIGALTGSGNLALANVNTLTLGGANRLAFYSGALGGSASLVKVGTGDQVLSGNNTYTGSTTINQGSIVMGHANALGGNPYSEITLNGGSLNLGGFNLAATHPLTVSSLGGGLCNSYTGTTSTVSSDSVTLNSDFLVSGTGDINLDTTFGSTQTRTLMKYEPGTLSLSGSDDNAYLSLYVHAGTVNLNKTNTSPTVHAVGGTGITGVDAGGTVRYTGSGDYQLTTGSVINLNGGTIDFNGRTQIGTSMAITQAGSKIANSSYGVQYAPSEIAVAPGVQSFEVNTATCLDLQTGITCDTSTGVWTNLIKTGTGRLMLNGPSDNTHLTLSVTEGDVQLYKESGPNVHAAAAMSVKTGARAWYSGSGDYQLAPGHWLRLQGGTIDLNGRTQRGTSLIVENANSVLENTASSAALYVPNSVTLDTDLNVNTVGDLEIDGSIARGAGVQWPVLGKLGSGVLTLSGTTDNSNVTLNAVAGTICLNKQNTSLGGAHAATAAIVRSGATVKYAGSGDYQIANGNWIQLLGGTLDLNGKHQAGVALGSFAGSVGSTLANTADTASVLAPTSVTLDADLAVRGGSGGLTIDGPMTGSGALTAYGLVTLAGANTFSGPTTVNNKAVLRIAAAGSLGASSNGIALNGGTLLINTTSPVTRFITFDGGTIGGNGRYDGNLALGNGHLSPGDGGVGTMTQHGSLTLDSSSVLDFDLGSTSGVSDRWAFGVAGCSLILDGTLNLAATGPAAGGDYVLFSGASNITDNGLDFGNVPAGHTYSYRIDNNAHTVIVTTAPEPGTIVILGTALSSLLAYVWRKRRSLAAR